MNDKLYKLRGPQKSDINFILSSWLKSFYSSKYNLINDQFFFAPDYWKYMKLLIQHIINKSLITVLVNPEDTDQIYGWACYQIIDSKLIIHWVYVKYTFRKLGFGKHIYNALLNLISDKEIIITFKPCYYDDYKETFSHTYNEKYRWEQLNDK